MTGAATGGAMNGSSRPCSGAREMEVLGADVKGLWLVDFDSGAGYYCWQWPEQELAFFHTYDEGFAGRTRIQ